MDDKLVATKLVLWSVNLAGYTRACTHHDALTIGRFVDAWYAHCVTAVHGRGGRIVKFIGDGCLAQFGADRAVDAIDAVTDLSHAITALRASSGLKVELGANVHAAVVAAGVFGSGDDARYDVIGSGVNHLFRMGAGPGVRISEPIYRQLPDERRGPWRRDRPPATYSLSES